MKSLRFLFFFTLVLLSKAALSQVVKKRIYHGVAVVVAPDSIRKKFNLKNGLLVNLVVPNGTGAAAGLDKGDIILSVNGKSMNSTADLRNGTLITARSGDTIAYKVLRNGKTLISKGIGVGRGNEQAPDIEYSYHDIPYQKGSLRAIISRPSKTGQQKLPAVFFIQGYTCGEMVDIDTAHPYRRLTDGLTRTGYTVMRVEKPGVGDCINTPGCGDIDFKEECEAFENALLYFKKAPGVDSNQITLWGHSLGGIITPVLTSKHQWLKAAIVYGTLSSIWGEYLLHMTRVQNEGFAVPAIEVERTTRATRKILYEIYTMKKSPSQFVRENPDLKEVLQTQFMWEPGTDRLFTRSAKFNQSLDDLNPTLLWSQTSCKVLGIYGEADIEALNPEGTKSLINAVNQYHPGNGTYQFLPGTDHSFAKVGTIADGYRTKADPNYGTIMVQNFNPEVINSSVNWLNSVLGRTSTTSKVNDANLWVKLKTEAYRGKQDDICFIDENRGWYVNGAGNIYKTVDGGLNWNKIYNKPGTFFRCIAFIDSLTGFAGNVGTDYFPNVSDTIPLYKTTDGGSSWTPVSYSGPYVKGLCAIDIVKQQYINHGQIDYKYFIYGVGRVGSPANMMVSEDGGLSFKSWSMQTDCKMLFDIKMFNTKEGYVAAASSDDVAQSNALVLYTKDGGKTWEKQYQSSRPFETTWKLSFPTRDTGYVTIQNYNPDKAISQQRIAKTVDGGKTWQEMDLCNDYNAREFGIGFIDALHGFVGTMNSGYETKDGGKTWEKTDLGRACNKIRIYTSSQGKKYGYAIGVDVFKLKNN